MFKLTISVGDMLTALAVLVSAAGLFTAWTKDRNLRRKAYADQIRQAAAITIAKLERWQQLSLGFFSDLQPLITDADMDLTENQDLIKVRDSFWRVVANTHTSMIRSILDEQIEIAYSQLLGYDPKIYGLFSGAVERLRLINELTLNETLLMTQKTIWSLKNVEKFDSAMLGNQLREICAVLHLNALARMQMILEPFRKEVLKIIKGGDQDIEKRRVGVHNADSVLPSPETIRGPEAT